MIEKFDMQRVLHAFIWNVLSVLAVFCIVWALHPESLTLTKIIGGGLLMFFTLFTVDVASGRLSK